MPRNELLLQLQGGCIMARNKMKQKIAAVLATVLVLQGMPISVLATETETTPQ